MSSFTIFKHCGKNFDNIVVRLTICADYYVYTYVHLYTLYTVSQKVIPDIIGYNSKQDKQILIIFGACISNYIVSSSQDINEHTNEGRKIVKMSYKKKYLGE